MEKNHHRPVHKKRGGKIVALTLGAVLLAAVGCVAFASVYRATTISENIYVHNLHVGGMTVDEATQALNAEFGADYFGKKVTVAYDGKSYEADLLGVVELDAADTARDALGRSNNLIKRLWGKQKDVVPFDLKVDEDKLEQMLEDFADDAEEKYGLFTFNEDYTSVDVDATKLGKIMDVEKTADKIERNAENNIFDPVEAVVIGKGNEDYVDELFDRLDRPARNASIGMNDDKSTYVIPERIGIKADEDTFERLYKANNGVFTMEVKPIQPEITATELDIEFYQDVLGSYTSAYNVGLVNRSKNVALAARLVNGTVIMPGGRFSYNGVVGKRTYERGFVDATVYTGEGTEEGIGGGICQVSSTIYCAQLRADLKTVARTNHSYTIVYVPLGQDATVVYGAIDYIFENNTNYPIKILANANGGYLTVKIMGTKINKDTTLDIVSVTEATFGRGELEKETPDLPLGTTEVKQGGQNGARVSTYKVYYKNGIEQKREFIATSTYKPMNKIILVGTGEATDPENPEVTDNPDATQDPDNTENPDVTDNPEGEAPDATENPDEEITDNPDEENPEAEDVPAGDGGSDAQQPTEEEPAVEQEPAPNTSESGL